LLRNAKDYRLIIVYVIKYKYKDTERNMLHKSRYKLPNRYNAMIEQLYSKHKPTLVCVAMRIVNNKDHAFDVVHSSFISVIKHAEKLSNMSEKEVKGYLILTVRNRALDFLRLSENKNTVPFEVSKVEYLSEFSSAEKEAILNIQIEEIMLYIEKLDSKYSVAVFHKYVLGFSIAEVASLLKISTTNAKVRCSRGSAKLLNLMKAGEVNE